jgi:hypothetical protein
MQQKRGDITPHLDLTSAKGTGPFRTRRPVYTAGAMYHPYHPRAAWDALTLTMFIA